MTGRLHGFIEQSHLMRLNVENKQEREKALIAAACSDGGCGSGAAPSRYLICCVFIVTLILDLVLWEALLLRSHNNNSGFRLAFFSTVTSIKPVHEARLSANKWDTVEG